MSKILHILQSEYSSEYFVKKYSIPKIYPKIVTSRPISAFSSAEKKAIMLKYKGKRWYVYYQFVNEEGQMKRQPSIYFNVNRDYPDFDSRVAQIKKIRNTIEKALKGGFSPLEVKEEDPVFSAIAALDFAFDLKKNSLGESSYNDYLYRLNHFKKYIQNAQVFTLKINQIDTKLVNNFLNQILKKTSPRNRNNTKRVLSALFSILEDQELIDRNFIKNIKNIKTKSERNKTYSLQKVTKIFKFLESEDSNLLFYIKFISYNFLRPIEACRIRVKDIDLENKQLTVKAKNKVVKIKIIPQVLINELKQKDLSNLEHFLFTPNGPGEWTTSEVGKRNYFTKRYARIKKKLNISKDYTVYSFRHTFITKLYRELRLKHPLTETLDTLMLITGHATLKALREYLRDIDAELPEDYSKLLEIKD